MRMKTVGPLDRAWLKAGRPPSTHPEAARLRDLIRRTRIADGMAEGSKFYSMISGDELTAQEALKLGPEWVRVEMPYD